LAAVGGGARNSVSTTCVPSYRLIALLVLLLLLALLAHLS
jgi:hypothetical protein